MAEGISYTDRVVRGADGVYRWRAAVSRQQKGKVIKITLGVCGGFCALLAGVLLAAGARGEALTATLLSCLAVMVIAGLVCLFYSRSAGLYQRYAMGEDFLRFVGGYRNDTVLTYPHVRKLRIAAAGDLIEVKALVWIPFFIPHEDFRFVQDHILRRIPETAEIEYRE